MPGPQAHGGGCLCGAVRYRVNGPLRDVFVCHCSVCARTHGGPAFYSACEREDLELTASRALRWHHHDGAERAFCGECGGRLFWSRPGRTTVSIAAGSLDPPTGLHTARHIFVDDAGDWEDPPTGDHSPQSRTSGL